MGKLGTLAPTHRAGELCPSPVVLGVRVSANLMILKVHKYSQRSSYKGDTLPELELYPELYCVLLWPSPRDKSWTALFNYHLSQLRDLCDIANVAYRCRSQLDRSGNGAAWNLQLSHITQTRAQLPDFSLYLGPSSGQVRCIAGTVRYTCYPVAFFNCLLWMTTAHPLWSSHWCMCRTGASVRTLRSSRPEFKSSLSDHMTSGQCKPLNLCFNQISLIAACVCLPKDSMR